MKNVNANDLPIHYRVHTSDASHMDGGVREFMQYIKSCRIIAEKMESGRKKEWKRRGMTGKEQEREGGNKKGEWL